MAADPSPPILAGRYRVVGRIGEGGMGHVLEVEVAPGRRYAAKVLKKEYRDDGELVRRMFREAQSAAAIRHPGIVGIQAIAHDDRFGPVLIMERLEGESVRRIAERERLDPVQARWLALLVLDTLSAAHRHGIVHRDVKPGNIYVEAGSGRVRLMDFGVAGVLAGPNLTLPGKFLGTMRFASPEQILAAEFSPRSDLYSLGVSLLWAMTGRHVPNRDVMAQRSPRSLLARQDLSPWWRAVLERALDPDPVERFESAEAMAQAIRDLPDQPLRPLLPRPGAPPDVGAPPPPTEVPAPDVETAPETIAPAPGPSLATYGALLGCLGVALVMAVVVLGGMAWMLSGGPSR